MEKIIVEKDGRRLEFDVDSLMVDDGQDIKVYELGRRDPVIPPGPWLVKASGRSHQKVCSKVVWQNECRLVLESADNNGTMVGSMGLCYPEDGTEVQVHVRSTDPNRKHELMKELYGKPVRVTIEVVPEGNV